MQTDRQRRVHTRTALPSHDDIARFTRHDRSTNSSHYPVSPPRTTDRRRLGDARCDGRETQHLSKTIDVALNGSERRARRKAAVHSPLRSFARRQPHRTGPGRNCHQRTANGLLKANVSAKLITSATRRLQRPRYYIVHADEDRARRKVVSEISATQSSRRMDLCDIYVSGLWPFIANKSSLSARTHDGFGNSACLLFLYVHSAVRNHHSFMTSMHMGGVTQVYKRRE